LDWTREELTDWQQRSIGMASSAANAAFTAWQKQVASMRSALADLKFPKQESAARETVGWTDSDEEYPYGSHSGGRDVWDFISATEIEQLGLDSGYVTPETDSEAPSANWFVTRCSEVAARRDGLPPETLQERILAVLRSSRPENELQGQLTDLVGLDDLDFVIELLSRRNEIASSTSLSATPSRDASGPRLLTKAQREEELRRKDFQHKTATLAAASAKEPTYPHVFRAHSAGHTLSYMGNRYALPAGHQRIEHEKYEEYSIPAGKTGTLGPGQQLVKISDLDGLCQRTFRGYKTLNRMQSLVYPVAYKSSENMLICAPTGAVGHTQYPPSRKGN
jgi:antiviral helicase SLH1